VIARPRSTMRSIRAACRTVRSDLRAQEPEQTASADEAKSIARQIEHSNSPYGTEEGWVVAAGARLYDDGVSAGVLKRAGFLRR